MLQKETGNNSKNYEEANKNRQKYQFETPRLYFYARVICFAYYANFIRFPWTKVLT